MDKELENLLREAHALGAKEADLDQIVAAYGSKKKSPDGNALNTGSNPFSVATAKPEAPQVYTPARQKEFVANNTYTPPKNKPKSLKEAVDDDDSYLGAIWNQIPNAISDAVGGLSKFAGKGLVNNPYVQALEGGFEIAKQATGSEADNPISEIATSQNAERVGKVAEQVVQGLRTSSSSKSNEERIQQGFDVTDGVSMKDIAAVPVMLTRLAADIGLAVPSSGISFAAQGYNQGLREYDQAVKDNPEIGNENVRELFGIVYGGINGLADKVSLGVLTKNKAVSKSVKSFILKTAINSLKETKGKVTSEAIEKAIQKAAKETVNKVKTSGVKFLKAGGAEGGTEAIQGSLNDGLKVLANKVQDANVFNIQEIAEDFWTTRINEAAGGALLGGTLGAGLAGLKSSDKYVAERVAESTTPEDVEFIKQELAGMVESGELTQDRAEALVQSVDTYSAANQKLPVGLSTIQRVKALQLVRDRNAVKKQKEEALKSTESVDDAIKPELENEVAILENKEQQHNDEIREIATEGKYKYFKDPEKDKWYKRLGEGKPEEITQEYYELQKQDTYIPKELTSQQTLTDTQEQTNLEPTAKDTELNDGETTTGTTADDTGIETTPAEGTANEIGDSQEVSEVGSEVVDGEGIKDNSAVLAKAETDLAALKQVSDKTKKYEGSIKRLTEAKNSGLLTDTEFNDIKARFDDVIAEYTPKGVKATKVEEIIPDEVQGELDDSDIDGIEVPESDRSEHSKKKEQALSDIKTQWQKLASIGAVNDPAKQNDEINKLYSAVAKYAYHSFMDGSVKLKGKIADRVDEIINRLGLTDITKNNYKEIAKQVKAQADKAKADIKSFTKPVKQVIKESTQNKSDFKQKDLVSRLTQMKHRLADEVRGFRKGVTEGKAIAKEKQVAKDDILSGLREEIKLQIKEAKESGLISQDVKPGTFVNAVNRVNNAKTPMQLLKAIDYMTKVFGDIDYDNNLSTANQLRSQVKSLAKRKGIPSNIAEAMRNIARFAPSELDDIKEYNKLLTEVIDNIKGSSVTGVDAGLLNDVADWLNKEQQRKLKERYELLLGEQDGLSYGEKTLDEMKAEIEELTSEGYEGKDNRRDADEAVSELLREDLLDADLSDYTHPQEAAAIKALKEVDLSGLTDKDLRLYNIAVNNLLLNGKLNGIGTIIAVARKQKNFSDKSYIAKIKGTTRAVSQWADGIRKNWATIPTQLKAIANEDRALAKYYVVTGLADIKNGYTRVVDRIGVVEKEIERIIKKHKGLRDSPKRQLQVAVFADLNQFDEGSTQEQIKEQFDGRKDALLETINRLKTKSSTDKAFKKQHTNYIGLLEEIYDTIKGLNSVDDIKLEADQLELYNYMRNYYNSIQEDTRLNAEIYNNVNFKPVVNYFPRTYNKVDDLYGAIAEKQMETKIVGASVFYDKADLKREQSGTKKSRTITGKQLPQDRVINLDLVSNFLNTTRNILYDIETQPARQYANTVITSRDMQELTTDDSVVEITNRVAKQLVRNQRLGILPHHAKTIGKAFGEFWRGSANRFALGGAAQSLKQSASAFTTTVGVLGKNAHLLPLSINELAFNNEGANKLMEGLPISRRAQEKAALTHVNIKETDVSKLNRSMEKTMVRVFDGWNDFADFVSLKPLVWGDMISAKASWLAFYKDFLIKEGIIKDASEFDLAKEAENRNEDAAEYAEQMVNTTLNINDRTMASEMSPKWGILPFLSFSINAKINLAIDIARASRKGVPQDERVRAARMVVGHIASSIVLNSIGWAIRDWTIGEAMDVVKSLVSDDEDEEKKEKLLAYADELEMEITERNTENTYGYIAKDIVFGGILAPVTDPLFNPVISRVTAFAKGEEYKEPYVRPADALTMIGLYGIPAKAIVALGEKSSDLMLTDEEFLQQRYGIESADGSMLYVPKENRGEERPDWARKAMAISTAMTTAQVLSSMSSQEIGSIARRLPGIVKKLEDKKYGGKRKFNPEAVDRSLSEFTHNNKTYVLNDEQLRFRKAKKQEFLKERYAQLKQQEGSDKEKEQAIREVANERSKLQTIMKYGDKLQEK